MARVALAGTMSLAVEFEHVDVNLPGAAILRDVNWQLPRGSRAVILGPNGCGKSTLLRVITAYGHFTSGCVRVLGQTLGRIEVHALRKQLGVVDPVLLRKLDPGVTAEQLVATGLHGHLTTYFDPATAEQLQMARAALAEVGMGDHAQQLVETLSSGQLSRTWLARALVHTPSILLLDEPAAALDLLGRETLLASLAALSRRRPELTRIMVTHHLDEILPDTDQVLLLSGGRIVASGPPPDVLRSDTLSRAFDCPVAVCCENGRWRWSVSPAVWEHLL
jgi:iron complex transport system ATP-binding protein